MKSKNFFALLTLSALLTLCLTAAAGAAMSDEDFTVLCYQGSAEKVQAALLKGANPNAKNNGGKTALMMAAAFNKNPEVLSLLLKAGADVNAKAENGGTALMWASAHNNNPDAVSVLLKAGADVNAKSNDGKTALDLAQDLGNVEVVKVLEDAAPILK